MAYRPRRVPKPRLALAGAAALALLLPVLQTQAGIGREAWEDPSTGPFRDDPAGMWALFVLNLEDPRCDDLGGLGPGDAVIARAVRQAFLDQGVPDSHITILLSRGDATYAAATETNLRAWITAVAPQANARPDSRVFFMLSGHGLPYALSAGGGTFSHPLGSAICLNGEQEMSDQEFAGYLQTFAPHVQIGLAMSCSLCGGFAERIYGPVETVGTRRLDRPGLVSTVGCGMATECTGDRLQGSYYHIMWTQGFLSGEADGWTWLAGQDALAPYDSRSRDGRVTLEEAYWWALAKAPTQTSPVPAAAFANQFQILDGSAGGFVLSAGGPPSIVDEGTGECGPDLRDYDEDGAPNALDTVNSPEESRESVAEGGYVVTSAPTSAVFRLVVTSPSGNAVTFTGGQRNMSLDAFEGEAVDGTWVFDLRGAQPNNNILEVALNGKGIRDQHAKLVIDAGLTAWNWHAESRLDDSPLLDVDVCPATGLRFYRLAAPEGLT